MSRELRSRLLFGLCIICIGLLAYLSSVYPVMGQTSTSTVTAVFSPTPGGSVITWHIEIVDSTLINFAILIFIATSVIALFKYFKRVVI